MTDHKSESELERQIKAALDESTEHLEGRVLSRLNQARHSALAELEGARRGGRAVLGPAWLSAGGVAAAVIVGLMLWVNRPDQGPAVETAAIEDIDILVAGESLELIEELEFYEWLETEPDVG